MTLHLIRDQGARDLCSIQGWVMCGGVEAHDVPTFQESPNDLGLVAMSWEGVRKSSAWLSLKFPHNPHVRPGLYETKYQMRRCIDLGIGYEEE